MEEIRSTDEIEKLLTSSTPFHMEPDWELVSENSNLNCSHTEIEELLQKRIITLVDIEIMKALAGYHYLNSQNLTFYMNHISTLHPNYQKPNYLTNLNKLKRAGIVIRYGFYSLSVNQQTARRKQAASPLRLYQLSTAAYTYIEPIADEAHPYKAASTLHKLEIAILNQFLLQFRYHYQTNIKQIFYQQTNKINQSKFIIDAIIQYQSETALPTSPSVSFLILSFRKGANWLKRALNKLQLAKLWLEPQFDGYFTPYLIILLEDILTISSFFAQVQSVPTLKNLPLYFCTDRQLLVYPPFDCLYSCKLSDDKKVIVLRNTITL